VFQILSLAHELGKSIDEVSSWSLEEVKIWLAYFKVRADLEAKEREKNKRKGRMR
jgi:hypothetical protein